MLITRSLQALDQAAGPAQSGIAVAADVALIVLGALALISVVVVVVLLIQLRSLARALLDASRSLESKADPLLERARGIAANVEFISAAVRTDVEHLNASVKALSERLQQASDHMEERIEEFNALMEVVQGEAEHAFLDTASAVRGIRAGAHRLANPARAHGEDQPPPEPADESVSPAVDGDVRRGGGGG
jgi:hypothetical protein